MALLAELYPVALLADLYPVALLADLYPVALLAELYPVALLADLSSLLCAAFAGSQRFSVYSKAACTSSGIVSAALMVIFRAHRLESSPSVFSLTSSRSTTAMRPVGS